MQDHNSHLPPHTGIKKGQIHSQCPFKDDVNFMVPPRQLCQLLVHGHAVRVCTVFLVFNLIYIQKVIL